MRLLALNLERYGPFTGHSLTFRPDAKLHIVYGLNEAGKSTSLAAVTDLLFGIDRQTRYDFLHEGKELRIGGTIVSRNGGQLSFKRRKGNKNTLLGADDRALADDILAPFLGSLSRDVFCNAFGLNSMSLRQGAEEMLNSQGDVGASLFAAASGLRGLTELRRNLEEEADEIFAPRASKERRFYQALDRFEEARKAVKDHELRTGEWKSLIETIDGNAKQLEEIKAELAKNAAAHARLSRLKRVLPLIRIIDQDLARIAALGTLPEISPGFTDRLRTALDGETDAEDAKKRAFEDDEKATRELTGIQVDSSMLAAEGDVLVAFSEVGAYANDRRDSPRVQAEADDYRGRLTSLSVRLGLKEVNALERSAPSDAEQALIRALSKEGRMLAAEQARHSNDLTKERASSARIIRQRSEKGTLVDPRLLREKFTAFGQVLKQLDKRRELEDSIHAEEKQLSEAALRLKPTINDLEALALASLPSSETLARFKRDFDKIAVEIARAAERLSTSNEAISAINVRLHDRDAERPVPTKEVILVKRQQRDEEWDLLRGTLFGEPGALSGSALPAHVANFERYSSEGDRLGDEAAQDAERVAAQRADSASLLEELKKQKDAKTQEALVTGQQTKLDESWNGIWTSAGITPLLPSEMIGWLLSANGLLERRAKLNLLRTSHSAIDKSIQTIEPALISLANEAGLSDIQGLYAELLALRIEERLRALSESWEGARDLDTSLRDAEGRIEEIATAQTEVSRRHEEWQERWKLALPPIGLSEDAKPDEADAALEVWKDVPDNIRERDRSTRRVEGMQRNMAKFETRVKALVESLVPDLATMPHEVAAKALNERLSNAKVAEARRREAFKRREEAESNLRRSEATSNDASSAVAILAAELPTDTDLLAFLTRSDERGKLLDALAERRLQLVAQADGYDEVTLRSDLANFDPDQAEASLQKLSSDDDMLNQKSREVFSAHDRNTRERTKWEQGVGAEVALQQRRSAEAELSILAREWAVLKLSSLLIGRAVDDRRASQHDPLIARASALFSTLTGNAFLGLGQEFDDQDVPRLVGKHSSGKAVPVIGMSDGTRDQLYLALRLAYLEDYSERCEPVPFIGDDIFTTFDDDRTAHGLAVLAATGDRVQPILFTHHMHVIEIARSHMGNDLDVLSLR